MTPMGPQRLTHFAGWPLHDSVSGIAEVDILPQSDTTTFAYPDRVVEVQQHWVTIRRYVRGKLHSMVNATTYKLTFITDTIAVVAIPRGDGPGRRYRAVGYINTDHWQPADGEATTEGK